MKVQSSISVSDYQTVFAEKMCFINNNYGFTFQETVCGTMTECSLVLTTVTTITGQTTVDQLGAEDGGITHATRQILMESMGTQITPTASIGTTGKVSITQ